MHYAILAILGLALVSAPGLRTAHLDACAVTLPAGHRPPDSVLAKAAMPGPASPNFHGTDSLWTLLWPDGTVVFRKGGPGEVMPDGSLRMKFVWLLAGNGPVTIDGRRLDGDARPLRSIVQEGFGGRGFQPSSLIFPTTGCWEVTARANGSALTFVTRVVKSD